MKYLFIAALLFLLFSLLYSRLRPYIKLIQKTYRALHTDFTSAPPGTATTTRAENKLIRCVGCGTWIPADRAIGLASGLSVYCSSDCLEKASSGKKRKLAG